MTPFRESREGDEAAFRNGIDLRGENGGDELVAVGKRGKTGGRETGRSLSDTIPNSEGRLGVTITALDSTRSQQ